MSPAVLDAMKMAQDILRLEIALTEARAKCATLDGLLDETLYALGECSAALKAANLVFGVQDLPALQKDFGVLYAAAQRVLDTTPVAFTGEPRSDAAAELRAQLERLRAKFEQSEAACAAGRGE